jgi:hypothetical protein
MPYTYDTTRFNKGFMMLGSSKIRTLDSLRSNFKRLAYSSVSSLQFDTDRYYIGGIPMFVSRMRNGKSVLRIINVSSISGLKGNFNTRTATTILNGSAVEVATNDRNDFILNIQQLSDLPYATMNKFTDYSGMQWMLDEDNSIGITVTNSQPLAFKEFIFGNKMLLCGQYRDGFSPIARLNSTFSP